MRESSEHDEEPEGELVVLRCALCDQEWVSEHGCTGAANARCPICGCEDADEVDLMPGEVIYY